MVNNMVKSLVNHNPNLILFSLMCCFKAGHPFSTCGDDDSLGPLVLSMFCAIQKLTKKKQDT